MNIVETPEGKLFSFDIAGGNPVMVPVTDLVLDQMSEVKKLSTAQQAAIIRDAGIEVPDRMITEDFDILKGRYTTFEQIERMSQGLVQNYWLRVTGVEFSEPDRWRRVQDLQEARATQFEDAKREVAAKEAPAPKAAKAPKASREARVATATGPKPASAPRISGGLYTISTSGDINLVNNLKGFRKSFYEALKAAGPEARLTKDEVLVLTIAAGAQFKTEGAAHSQVNFQLKELVTMNLVTLVAANGETLVSTQPAGETPAPAEANA
jgi:hypothetical protein